MLQKILVVIIGLIMSVVGALAPEGLFAANDAGDPSRLASNTAEETLASLRHSDGQAFARIPVLWIESEGRRVIEDAWGTGEVDEIKFKVGVKGVEDVALAVGDKIVELHPTDIITVRMFRGDFSYRGLNTPNPSLQIQGTIKSTVLNEGDKSNRVLTRVGNLDLDNAPAEGPSKVAYVILTTGQKVDTVAVEDGGSRLFTEEATTADSAKDEPGNLLAKWVKIDNKLVREYTWGDGTLPRIEFEPAEGATNSVVLAFNGEVHEIASGERVVVEDFVGEYLVYQVSGGMMRVRLDGYAASYKTGAALPLPTQGGAGAPLASFEFAPASPKTTDTVQFRDRSTDDGIIVFRQWDFGDNSTGVLQDPTHRFSRPGSYEVKLTVTDNDLKSTTMTRTLIVRNAEPVADFDFAPKIVTTDSIVAFSDRSYDSDGTIVNWTWDFGDGTSSHLRHPTHRFMRGGNATVTLSVVDELGARSSLSKVVLVRNSPPSTSFTYSPALPSTMDPVQFIDNSTDRDGSIVEWNWSFGDGHYGSGSAPVHAYARPGIYTVSLTVRDDGGDSDTASTFVVVRNRAPFADFTWTPEGEAAAVEITFTSTSQDPDGIILQHVWNWGDGSHPTQGVSVRHQFARAGTYDVTLSVTDNTLSTSNVTRSVTVANSAPRPNMHIQTTPTYRGVPVTFTDWSTDPDRERIVNSTWELDNVILYGTTVVHAFNEIGNFPVTLTVRDAQGQNATLTREVRVFNRPPTVAAQFGPRPVAAGESVTFSATGVDPDLPGGSVSFEWVFSDGVNMTGANVTRTFAERGNYTARVRGIDSEGAASPYVAMGFAVGFGRPRVDFEWTPLVPSPHQLVNFTSLAVSPNGPIREYRWNFGDGSPDAVSTRQDPQHVFRQNGTYTVRLEVTDIQNQTNSTQKVIVVNILPRPSFSFPSGALQLHQAVQFQDASTDPDGYITNWTWDLGDGRVSYAVNPTHPGYAAPGAYPVTLTVRDDRNGTNATTRTVNIANTAPVARWTNTVVGGGPEVVNRTISFNGYDRSYDPDGTPLTRFNWTFGDSPATASGANVTHVYSRSGRYTVGLTVGDALQNSVRTSESHRPIQVQPEHDVVLHITGVLPDGTPAPISLPPYAVSVRVNGSDLDGGAFVPVGNDLDARIGAPLWVNGDQATVRISASFLAATASQNVQLRDGLREIHVRLELRLAATASITPLGGEQISLFALQGNDPDHRGDPLYSEMTERPHGYGNVSYTDGSVIPNALIDIEARWVPLRALSPYRNMTSTPESGNLLPSWCRAAQVRSAANGTYEWAFDGQSPCYLNHIANGVYPIGRWEVRARPLVQNAENHLSPIRVFYVDPTGGRVLAATMGLA